MSSTSTRCRPIGFGRSGERVLNTPCTLRVRPRGDLARPEQGVFGTRSPDRPNPIGLHRVTVLEVDGLRMRVSELEALDGTPVVDVKPVIGGIDER